MRWWRCATSEGRVFACWSKSLVRSGFFVFAKSVRYHRAMGAPPHAPQVRRPRPRPPIPGYVYKLVVLAVLILLFWWLFKTYLSGGQPARYPGTFVSFLLNRHSS